MSPLTPHRRVSGPCGVLSSKSPYHLSVYTNLLMSEFTGVNGQGKMLAFALHDIVTPTNFLIAPSAPLSAT